MDKLISAEKLLKDPVFCGYHDGKQQHFNFGSATECIKNAPAVEAITLDELSEIMCTCFNAPCDYIREGKLLDEFCPNHATMKLHPCDCDYKDCWRTFFKKQIGQD